DPVPAVAAHHALGFTLLQLGDPAAAWSCLGKDPAALDPQPERSQAVYGRDLGIACRSHGAMALWLLGYPDQALEHDHRALTLAQEKADLPGLASTLYTTAILHQWRGEAEAARQRTEALLEAETLQGFALWVAAGTVLHGWALARLGRQAEGVAQLRQGIDAFRSTGAECHRPYHLALLAEALGAGGQTEQGLAAVIEALALVEATGEVFYEAELYRLRGELLRKYETAAVSAEAEDCFRRAAAIARRQGAKSLELRAVMSLLRLLREQGRAEGRPLLAEAYGRFRE